MVSSSGCSRIVPAILNVCRNHSLKEGAEIFERPKGIRVLPESDRLVLSYLRCSRGEARRARVFGSLESRDVTLEVLGSGFVPQRSCNRRVTVPNCGRIFARRYSTKSIGSQHPEILINCCWNVTVTSIPQKLAAPTTPT